MVRPPPPSGSYQAWNSAPSTSGCSTESDSMSVASRGKKRSREERGEEEDPEEGENPERLELLDDTEALEMIEFDPSISPKDTWETPKQMGDFLRKHFNRSLSEAEKEAILKDFPKPDCGALAVPKLDDQVKEQLRSRGKDPHFGSEKSLYKLQESVLDVAAPLTCLWADLLNKEAKVSKEDTLLLVQRALVLLGSASNQISAERRRIAWGKINPKLKSLANEDYTKRETNLFGPGFLEKATKRIEADKTMARVGYSGPSTSVNKRFKFSKDKADLRSFLSRGAPAQYGDRKFQRHQPYQPPPRRFQSKKYYKPQNQRDQSKPQRSPSS